MNDATCKECNFNLSDLGKAEFIHAEIDNVQFSFINGFGIQFFESRLLQSHFNRANLQNAEYENSILSEVKFVGALLKDANFRKAKMNKVDFSDADLSNTDFRGAEFQEVIFDRAKMDGAIFDKNGVKWLIQSKISFDPHILVEKRSGHRLVTYEEYITTIKKAR